MYDMVLSFVVFDYYCSSSCIDVVGNVGVYNDDE
jgi:hypothetical protein